MNSAMSANQLTRLMQVIEDNKSADPEEEQYYVNLKIKKLDHTNTFKDLDAELLQGQSPVVVNSPNQPQVVQPVQISV